MTEEEKIKYLKELKELKDESRRMVNICQNSHAIIENIDKRFKDITSFDKKDWTLLFFATSLQVVRLYLITKFEDT